MWTGRYNGRVKEGKVTSSFFTSRVCLLRRGCGVATTWGKIKNDKCETNPRH